MIKSSKSLPKTVEQSVEWLVSELPSEEKARIETGEWNLMDLYFALSVYIEDQFCILENKALVESCRSVSKDRYFLEEEASYIIIRELWRSLQGLYKWTIIKQRALKVFVKGLFVLSSHVRWLNNAKFFGGWIRRTGFTPFCIFNSVLLIFGLKYQRCRFGWCLEVILQIIYWFR